MNTSNNQNGNVQISTTEVVTESTESTESTKAREDFLTPAEREGHAAWKARKLKNRSKYI